MSGLIQFPERRHLNGRLSADAVRSNTEPMEIRKMASALPIRFKVNALLSCGIVSSNRRAPMLLRMNPHA
jgi:hypothetical protein